MVPVNGMPKNGVIVEVIRGSKPRIMDNYVILIIVIVIPFKSFFLSLRL